MGFDAGKENFDNVFDFLNAQSGGTAKFLEALAKYLEAQNEVAGAQIMSKWIKDNKGVSAYRARADCVEMMSKELSARAVPYVRMRQPDGSDYYLIRSCDNERVKQINKDVLTIKGNYYQQVSAAELEQALANAVELPEQDRQIASIDGLTNIQAEVLKGKCSNMGEGFTIAIEKLEDGTNRLSCQSSKVVTPNMQREDMGKAFNEMAFSLYGPNAKIREAQAKADIQFNQDVFNYDVVNGDGFILGADNTNCFIVINEHGFDFKKVTVRDGMMNEDAIDHVDASMPDYKEQLQSYMCKLQNKVFTYDRAAVDKHFQTKGVSTQSKRPVKNELEQQISDGESALAEKIDEMIKNSEKYKLHVNDPAPKQFNLYQDETVKIMAALSKNKQPDEYSKEQFDELGSICRKYNLNIEDYKDAVKAIDRCEMTERLAENKTKSLDEKLKTFEKRAPHKEAEKTEPTR